ncbi:hypothetical protein F5Y10DRAFT_147191 [Nemania abortiva]|nr:hypothetical protein F5Y10DRAFT_147191 [Nemania abortiva]
MADRQAVPRLASRWVTFLYGMITLTILSTVLSAPPSPPRSLSTSSAIVDSVSNPTVIPQPISPLESAASDIPSLSVPSTSLVSPSVTLSSTSSQGKTPNTTQPTQSGVSQISSLTPLNTHKPVGQGDPIPVAVLVVLLGFSPLLLGYLIGCLFLCKGRRKSQQS